VKPFDFAQGRPGAKYNGIILQQIGWEMLVSSEKIVNCKKFLLKYAEIMLEYPV